MKISSFIIGLLLIAMFVGILGLFFLTGSVEYSQTLDNDTFDNYEKLNDLNTQINATSTKLNDYNPYNPIDIIGGFLSGGYQAIKVAGTSFTIFTGMADDATNKVGSAFGGQNIMLALKIIAFTLFTFIIISIFVGRDV